MERFWIDVTFSSSAMVSTLGIGVTAQSETDAADIVTQRFGETVRIRSVRRIADMRAIDQLHVAPNIGNHFVRGIWFPDLPA